jgi:iron complex transport system ATP-binding protein
MTHMLRVDHVEWRAGDTTIVERVAFDACSGEFIALMGRNGAGKSTVLDLVAGLRVPTKGRVCLDDQPLDRLLASERARHVGHLPQMTRGELPFTVEQLVLMGRYPHAARWFESADDRRAAEEAMVQCQCLSLRHRRLSTLSGGERQRAMLAACLAQQSHVLLLDEPSTFLDVDQQLHCFSLLRDEAAAGRICLAVTHDLNLALTFCTRIIVLSKRTVAADMGIAQAREQHEWLDLFSPRLQMSVTPDGRPWVCYR